MSSCRLLLAQTTCADEADAERLARALVEARLAACVSIGAPTRSIYPWKGRIEVDEERVLSIKTAPSRVEELKRFISEQHEYDVPELLISPVTDGAEAYLEWAEEWMRND